MALTPHHLIVVTHSFAFHLWLLNTGFIGPSFPVEALL